MEKKEYKSLDILKYIVSFLIVAIHTLPFKDISENSSWIFTNTICRIAVPLFFISSGFFICDKAYVSVVKWIKRIGSMYVIYTVLYIPLIVIEYRAKGLPFFEAILVFIQETLFKGSYTHLWFFPAIMIGAFMCYILFSKIKSRGVITLVILIFFTIGVIGNEFKELLFCPNLMKTHFINIYYDVFLTTRNGVFFAFPFMATGWCIKKYEFINKYKNGYLNVLIFTFSVLFMIEKSIFFMNPEIRSDNDIAVMLLPLVVILFIRIMQCNTKVTSDKAISFRNQATLIFGVHLIVIFLVAKVINVLSLEINSLFCFIIVCWGSAFISLFAYRLSKTNKFAWIRWLY